MHAFEAFRNGAHVIVFEKRGEATRFNVVQLNAATQEYTDQIGWLHSLGLFEIWAPHLPLQYDSKLTKEFIPFIGPKRGEQLSLLQVEYFLETVLSILGSVSHFEMEGALGADGDPWNNSLQVRPLTIMRRVLVCGVLPNAKMVRVVVMEKSQRIPRCRDDWKTVNPDVLAQEMHLARNRVLAAQDELSKIQAEEIRLKHETNIEELQAAFEAMKVRYQNFHDFPVHMFVIADGSKSGLRTQAHSPIALKGRKKESKTNAEHDPLGVVMLLNGPCPDAEKFKALLVENGLPIIRRTMKFAPPDFLMVTAAPNLCYIDWCVSESFFAYVLQQLGQASEQFFEEKFIERVTLQVKAVMAIATKLSPLSPILHDKVDVMRLGLHVSPEFFIVAAPPAPQVASILVGDASKRPFFPKGISLQTIHKAAFDFGFWGEAVRHWRAGSLLSEESRLNSLLLAGLAEGVCRDLGDITLLYRTKFYDCQVDTVTGNSTTDLAKELERARSLLEMVLEKGTLGEQSGAELNWTKFCKKYYERVVLPFALERARAEDIKFGVPPTWNELYPGVSQVSSAAVKSMSESAQSASQ